jgi:hypothetical protein
MVRFPKASQLIVSPSTIFAFLTPPCLLSTRSYIYFYSAFADSPFIHLETFRTWAWNIAEFEFHWNGRSYGSI